MERKKLLLSLLMVLLSVFLLTACNQDPVCDSGYTLVDDECVLITEPISFSVSLNSSTKSITQGDSFILVVTLDGITDYDSVGWASENDLLTIAPDGLNAVITAGTVTGTDTITVTVTKGDVSETADCEVTVNPVTLSLSVESESITMFQGESRDVVVTIDPDRDETVLGWSETGSLLDIDDDGNTATITAGAATGTTTLVITATIFGTLFTKEVSVTVNKIQTSIEIQQSFADVNVEDSVDISLSFVTAYQSSKTWSVAFSTAGIASAEVTEDDVLRITGIAEGETTLTLTMTSNGVAYTDTITVTVRPLGYVGISNNVYDPYDLQLNFTESILFSSIDEEIWQNYDIILGGASNDGEGDLRGQFIFKINTIFAKDGEKDVIQVMANGMSAIAVKIPDTIDDLAAIEFSMKMATLDPSHDSSWRLQFFIATVVDGKTIMYGRETDENNAISLGTLTITPEELLREGYQNYKFFVDNVPENAGNYIVIYLGNTNLYNGDEGNRTFIDGFNFINKEYAGIELTTLPTDLEYVVGQDFDPTDLVVSALYTAGNVIPIDHEDLTFDYDFSSAGTKTVTVNYGDDSVSFNVTVVDRVISALEITTQPDKIVYSEGEVFDPTGMVITAVYNDESTEVVTTYTYDMNQLVGGTEVMEISFGGLTVDVSITVNAAALTSIAITSEPTLVEYVVGQAVNYDGLVVTATYDDLSEKVIAFEELTITGFDSSAVATDQVITVAYGDQTATFTIDIIEKEMVGLQIQSYPRIVYMVGENYNWTGLSVAGVYNDGDVIELDFANLAVTGFDSSVAADITISITYQTFTATFPVYITDLAGFAEMLSTNAAFPDTENSLVINETYYHTLFSGDTPVDSSTFDVLLGRTVNDEQRLLQYSDLIYINEDGVIVISANGMSAMAVRIPDGMSAADITAFTISLSGEGLDAIITDINERFRPVFRFSSIFDGVEYFHTTDRGSYFLSESGRMTIYQPEFVRTGYNDYTVFMSQPDLPDGVTLGNYILIYMGNDGTFRDSDGTALKVDGFKFWTRDAVADIAVNGELVKTEYVVGEEFDPTGLDIVPMFGIELHEPFSSLSYDDLTYDYDFSVAGTATVTISYGNASATLDVQVIDRALTSIEITTQPTKVVYKEDEVFDPTDMVVTAFYNDGTSEVVLDYTYDMNPLLPEVIAMEISYGGFIAEVPITVNPKVLVSIAITTEPTKLEYVVGQVADYDGLVVTATYDDSSTAVIAIGDLGISGFDSSAAVADQTITITLGDQTATFTIDVIPRQMISIDIDDYPQVIYEVGDSAAFSDMVVVGVFNDDTTEVLDSANYTVTGFDSSAAANVLVTVTYQTFTKDFYVQIKEVQTSTDYVELFTANMDYDTTDLVNQVTMFTDFFSGDTPASIYDYDVLLGRTLNDTERMLQYSEIIYFEGDGIEMIIVVQANGMSAMAVRIPDGMTAADITAFTISLSGEGLDAIITDPNENFRPRFRFSSIFDGVEYFHTTDKGMYYLPESGRLQINQPEFIRPGYYDYTVVINQPALDAGESLGNYMIIYMGNDGTFRDSDGTSLKINGFKFWTADLITDITLTTNPTKTTYTVGEAFDPTGLVITPTNEF